MVFIQVIVFLINSEEDKKLMDLAKAQSGKRDWQKIAEQFSSFKNRKGCLTRHKILVSKIGEGVGKFRSVEEVSDIIYAILQIAIV